MNRSVVRYGVMLVVALAVLTVLVTSVVTANEQMQLPPARKVPGLTAEDGFPGGCVDCHINMPERKQDERISTLMMRWGMDAGPKLTQKAQAAAPAGAKLKGVHPQASAALKNIPTACSGCHSKTSRTAPPLGDLIHAIHLTGGEANHFMTIFQGECTYCHKLNAATGAWTMPSGAEK